jgi:hypothetical protein
LKRGHRHGDPPVAALRARNVSMTLEHLMS